MVPLKYISSFWGTLEMPLINYEIILILTWSAKCVLPNAANQATASGIADTKCCVSVVSLSAEESPKPLQLLNQNSNAQLIALTMNQKEHRWQINS